MIDWNQVIERKRQLDDRINTRIKEDDAAHCINWKVGLGGKEETRKENVTGKDTNSFKRDFTPQIFIWALNKALIVYKILSNPNIWSYIKSIGIELATTDCIQKELQFGPSSNSAKPECEAKTKDSHPICSGGSRIKCALHALVNNFLFNSYIVKDSSNRAAQWKTANQTGIHGLMTLKDADQFTKSSNNPLYKWIMLKCLAITRDLNHLSFWKVLLNDRN